jgi:hypothetical protein
MQRMDPIAFLIANDATRTALVGAEPWDRRRRPRRTRRTAERAERIR